MDGRLIWLDEGFHFGVDFFERLGQIFHMFPNFEHPPFLVFRQAIPFDGVHNLFCFLAQGTAKERNAYGWVWIPFGQQIVGDSRCRDTEHVRHDGIQCDVAHRESVLEPVLLAGPVRDELGTVACKFSQDANGFLRDKAAFDEAEAEKLPDPFRVLDVILVALDGANPFGIGDHDTDILFQNIENGNPILAGGFHARVVAVVGNKPVPQFAEGFVERGEALFLVGQDRRFLGGHDGGNEKFLVDIDATTAGVDDLHDNASFLW